MIKHAYLIMIHDDLYQFEKLISLLDDKRNDLYIHVDKKMKNFDFNKYTNYLQNASVKFIDRFDVRWGSVMQIKVTLELIKASIKEKHNYYHFISGACLPIKNQDYIHDFFNKSGKDFIEYDDFNNISDNNLNRIKYHHLLEKLWRHKNKFIEKLSRFIERNFVKVEKTMGINRLKNSNLVFRKGPNWFSITENTAKYILEKSSDYLKYFRYSYCADELFVQSIIYNSTLKDNLYFKDNKTSCMRYIDWERGNPWTFKMEDLNNLLKSDMLFARKFSSKVDREIIDKIYKEVKK